MVDDDTEPVIEPGSPRWWRVTRRRRGAGRGRLQTGLAAQPADAAAGHDRALEVARRLSRCAAMPAPAVVVVASIGPRPRRRRRHRGALGQVGLTTAMPGRDPVITLAAAAMDLDNVDVLDHLVAHELGHVAYLRSPAGRRYQRAVLIGLVVLGLGLLAWFTGTVAQVSTGTNPWSWATLVWPTAGLLSLALLAVRRRQELAADDFAIRLVPNVTAAGALFELEEGDGVLAESRAISRLLAPHPPPRARLARMRRRLGHAA